MIEQSHTVAAVICEMRRLYGTSVSLDVIGYEIARCLKLADRGFDMGAFLEASHCKPHAAIPTPSSHAYDVIGESS